jgi:hypothetical protein
MSLMDKIMYERLIRAVSPKYISVLTDTPKKAEVWNVKLGDLKEFVVPCKVFKDK